MPFCMKHSLSFCCQHSDCKWFRRQLACSCGLLIQNNISLLLFFGEERKIHRLRYKTTNIFIWRDENNLVNCLIGQVMLELCRWNINSFEKNLKYLNLFNFKGKLFSYRFLNPFEIQNNIKIFCLRWKFLINFSKLNQ